MYGASIGKLGITTMPCTTNQAIASCKPFHGMDLYYLFYLLMLERPNLVDQGQGGAQPNISQTILKAHEVSVAPSNEQKRIVSKIEELFSRIEEGERALERAQKLVERYRQSVLKAAVTGELTRDWREKHKGQFESGEALLARILQARREAWKGKYKEPEPPNTSNLPALPAGWVWASTDQITGKVTSGSRDWKEYYDRGQSVFVMAQNVRRGRLDFSEIQTVDPPEGDRDAERSAVSENDLLVTIVGANTGDVCRVPEPLHKHYVCQSVALLRPVVAEISTFMELFLCADEGGQAQFAKEIYGAGRPHLSFDQIRATCIPLPGLEEQALLCNAVKVIESEIAAVESTLQVSKNLAAGLRQSILKSAFTGQLVPQDPNDEPASVLLKRIAAERAAVQNQTASKRPRPRKTKA